MTMHRQLSVDAAAQMAIRPYLRTAEPLVWAEKPPGWRLALGETFRLLFIVLWCVGVLVFVGSIIPWRALISMLASGNFRIETGGGPGLVFFAMPLLFMVAGIVGLVVSAYRFLGAWFTYYGLTDSRVLILRSLPPAKTVSLGPQVLSNMSRTGEDGRGTISFDDSDLRSNYAWLRLPRKLIGIRNPAGVEALIVSTLRPADTQGRY